MNLRASLSWGPARGGWTLLWLSNPKSWRLGEWKFASGTWPPFDPESDVLPVVWKYWRVGPLELRSYAQ